MTNPAPKCTLCDDLAGPGGVLCAACLGRGAVPVLPAPPPGWRWRALGDDDWAERRLLRGH